jgi:hypothetical protein
MWSHRDLGWWAFWISILALGSSFPLNVLANLFTPRFQNWLAGWSRASLQKRIAKLEIQLTEIEAREPITAIESYTLRRMELLEEALLSSAHLILTAIYFAVIATTTEFPNLWGYWFIGWIVFALLFNSARTIFKVRPSTEFRLPDRELSLKRDIAKLKTELGTK